MDLAKLLKLEGEWMTVELETTAPVGELRFKVIPVSFGETVELRKYAEKDPFRLIEFGVACIADWNLELNGEALVCNEENRRKYLTYLFDEQTKTGENLLVAIIKFAVDKKNYAKN